MAALVVFLRGGNCDADTWSYRLQNKPVGIIATDESPVFVCDHRSPNSADRAIWASNHKGPVGLNRLQLRVVWRMSDAKNVVMLKLSQLYRLRAGRYRRLCRDSGSSAKGSAGWFCPLSRHRGYWEEANNAVFPRYASGSPNQFSGFAMMVFGQPFRQGLTVPSGCRELLISCL